MLSPLTLTTCLYTTDVEGLKIDIIELSKYLEPRGSILAINSNFMHKAQIGLEKYLKSPKPEKINNFGKGFRKRQGDGTCFISTVEFTIGIESPIIPLGKVYILRYYPTTGKIQIPGVTRDDLSDADMVVDSFVEYLRECMQNSDINVSCKGVPLMMNYKFSIPLHNPRALINKQTLNEYIVRQKSEDLPYPLLYSYDSTDRPHALILKFSIGEKTINVNIWQSGKVCIMGGKSRENSENIYNYFNNLFTEMPDNFIAMKPLPDIMRSNNDK
jgi:hypothetical protein